MHPFRYILLPLVLASLAACATGKGATHPDTSNPILPRLGPRSGAPVPLSEAEQGLRSVIDSYKMGSYTATLLGARSLAGQYPGTVWYKRSLFLTEEALIRLDRPEEADALMLQIRAEYPEMADYAVFLLAEYHFSRQRFTRAAALHQVVVDHYPDSSLAASAACRRGLALLEAQAYAAAADALDEYLRDNPLSESSPDAALGLGRALLGDTRPEQAGRAFRDVWIKYPGTPAEQEALEALTLLSASGIEVAPWTGDELFERSQNLFRAAQYDKAVEAYGRLLEQDPRSPHRPEALFRIGLADFNAGKRGEAAVVLQKLVSDYPRNQRLPEALYWIGKSYSKLGEREKAVAAFQKILTSYRESEWADDALFLTGNIYREANDMKKAVTFYGRLVDEFPDSRFADSAVWWTAWSWYASGQNRQAEQKLQELVNRYPRSFLIHQARYWQGRIAEKTGDPAKAAEYYNRVLKRGPYTYYGALAADRLARLDGTEMPAKTSMAADATPACMEACADDPLFSFDTDEGPPVWTEEARQMLEAEPSYRKTLELMHLDMRREAAAELWEMQERLPHRRGTIIGLSKALFELGDYYRSLVLVLRSYEHHLDAETRNMPPDLWLLAYPQAYWDSILSYSGKYRQDPYFIAAIIREESQFHADALSPAGALGVMQVMPSTGAWIARNISLQGFEREKLFEADTAINLGTWYIGHLMKRFQGDPLFAAAAYNAGPDAVAGWMRSGRSRERDEFVESIPYAETRGYVKKVMRNYAEYRRIYEKTGRGTRPVSDNGSALGSRSTDGTSAMP